MQTKLCDEYQNTRAGEIAESILRKCVHCGFCTATCPTYQLLGDELDGPRGRIYLIKQVLEGQAPTRKTQQHLDRCLTCRNCETTCPSGVDYGHLVDIGRELVERKVERPMKEKAVRWLLKEGLTSPLFGPAMKLGQTVRPLLPTALQDKVPAKRDAGPWPSTAHERKVMLLAGCVQPSMSPNINAATARVLDAVGIQAMVAPKAGCCGAIKHHLSDTPGALDDMRANIDAWWPHMEGPHAVEALLMNASGCGATVRDYGHLLAPNPAYADKARRISAMTHDLSEWLPQWIEVLKPKLARAAEQGRLVFHPPCTLQHGQKLKDSVTAPMQALGFQIQTCPTESHLCCGSAGTYSVLQPALSKQLRDRKLKHLLSQAADTVVSANIGCITHLQSGTHTPVRHWVEVLDHALHG